MTVDRFALRQHAEGIMHQHNPDNQRHNYERCELCGFTRHPCDLYDLAEDLLALLDEAGS